MTRRVARVVKVGGSLFDFSGLPAALRQWLASQSPRRSSVLLAGGGGWAGLVRDAAQRYRLDEAACHWMCIDAMSVTARLLAQMMGLEPVRDWRWLQRESAGELPEAAALVFDCGEFLRSAEPGFPGRALPQSWDATSDSIAARLAIIFGADELVLLKSALPPDGATRCSCAGDYVDRQFPLAAQAELRVRCVNLRQSGWPEVELPAERAG